MPSPTCKSCGAPLSPNAKACPECGARVPEHSWEQDESYDGINFSGTPEDDFDYDEFIQQEFGTNSKGQKKFKAPGGISIYWWIIALITLFAFVFAYII
ncbi:MAG: zinc ribbon domain-containing protein [Verrucomicrobiota bacterium]